jgi:hypothetical protein
MEITTGAYATAATAKVEIDYQPGAVDANGNPILLVSKTSVLSKTFAASQTSIEDYSTTLPRNEIYQQISFFAADSHITFESLKIKLENNLIRDCTKGLLDSSNIARGLNPSSALAAGATQMHCVFDYDDQPNSALPMVYGGKQVQDFQVIPKLSVGDANTGLDIVYQTFGPIA